MRMFGEVKDVKDNLMDDDDDNDNNNDQDNDDNNNYTDPSLDKLHLAKAGRSYIKDAYFQWMALIFHKVESIMEFNKATGEVKSPREFNQVLFCSHSSQEGVLAFIP